MGGIQKGSKQGFGGLVGGLAGGLVGGLALTEKTRSGWPLARMLVS